MLSAPVAAQDNPEPLISQLLAPAAPSASTLQNAVEVAELYRQRQFAPVWTDDSKASEAIQLLRNSGADGLDPADFRLPSILAARKGRPQGKAAEFDVLLTDAVLSYIREMSGSRVDPSRLSSFIAHSPPTASASEILDDALTADTIASLPDKLAPPHWEYASLKRALAHYRAQGSKARVAQIIANMERWRWLPKRFEDFYVEVNSADSTLTLVKDNEVLFSTRLVTGRRSMPTPLFETTINGVTVNPYWDIPGDIAVHEMLPKEARHPGYLQSRHIVADRPGGALRQLAGPDNALGRFLLEMPNRFDAYLHDTPEKNLFEKSDRHFSHGCMRVENMATLAALLVTDGSATSADEIQSAVEGGQTQTLPLSHPVPVYVLYWTAVPNPRRTLTFHQDVYGWDAAVLAALHGHSVAGGNIAEGFRKSSG